MEPHSILKRPSNRNQMEIEEDTSQHQHPPHPNSPSLHLDFSAPRVSWDEPTLAEHLKLKGTYMKILEPKTPYHKPPGEVEEPEGFILNE